MNSPYLVEKYSLYVKFYNRYMYLHALVLGLL